MNLFVTMKLLFLKCCNEKFSTKEEIRDCAIIIRRGGAEKLEGGALHKIAAKIGGLKVKSLI